MSLRALVFAAVLLLPCPALACSLCGAITSERVSLVAELPRAKAVAYGRLGKPSFSTEPGAVPGSGTTPFHIEKLLKPDPALKEGMVFTLPRYLPVLDEKNPPRCVMYFDVIGGKLTAYAGNQGASPAFLDFLAVAQTVNGKSRSESLTVFAKYLADKDSQIADEAFLQFARSTDQQVMEATKVLKPDVFRALVKDPELEPERLSLFAYLLGATGEPPDADLLLGLLKKSDERTTKAMEGILAGYIARKPKEGWAWAYDALANPKQPFLVRFGVLRTMRFFANTQPAEHRARVVYAMGLAIPDGELADTAISDLRQWKIWDHTKLILAQYGKRSHDAPITKYSIARYAISAPASPERDQFLKTLRKQDPQLLRDVEDDLAFEQGKK